MPRVQRFCQLTVPITAYQIVPYNKKRVGILIKNYSGNLVFISNDQQDPLGQGFPLAVGDYLSFIKTDGDIPELQVYAIASGGTSDVRVVETFGEVPEAI